jgi:hypothetical protein
MKKIFCLLVLGSQLGYAQKLKKADRNMLAELKTHIAYLADDKLEGRRTGTTGEKLAYEYIIRAFVKEKLLPKGEHNGFLQDFEVNDGRQPDPSSYLILNRDTLSPDTDYFPLVFSANGRLEARVAPAIQESGSVWLWDLKDKLEENRNNPHFDVREAIKTRIADAAGKGATALVICNSSSIDDELKYEPREKTETAPIPVLYIRKDAYTRFVKDETTSFDISLNVSLSDRKRTGHNVIAYIDNGAANTIILGAHYDHLGYGEDHNSLYAGKTPMIHHGADDNASGTAALIELGKLLKKERSGPFNYLLIAFSGEELGLYGSKYFTDHPTIDLSNADYMINMDMVGRLNDSTHGLSIGGYGTSPAWGALLNEKDGFFKIKFDSSGTGPSDHTSFYRKNIPVLFFFTGVHSDYHKPTDVAEKINYKGEVKVIRYIYRLIEATGNSGKLAFSKTRETPSSGKASFRVTLGIMPDYTYSGGGVRVDGVSEGKLAQRTGIKAGDVIIQLGDHRFSDVQGYMEALGKFKKGDATRVKLKRGNDEMSFDIIF